MKKLMTGPFFIEYTVISCPAVDTETPAEKAILSKIPTT